MNIHIKNKRYEYETYLISAAYLLIIGFNSVIAYIRYFEFAYYDSSPELVLAQMLSEENVLLSKNWFYSAELRVLNTQIITSVLFRFIDNWRLVKAFTTAFHLLLMIGGANYLFSKLGSCKRYFFSGLLLLCPFSWLGVQYVLGGLFYIPHYFIIFVAIGTFIEFKDCSGKNRIACLIIELLIAIAAGAGGIRHLQITYVPLALSCLTCLLLIGNSFKDSLADIVHVMIVCICACSGYVLNSEVLSRIYSFADYNNINLRSMSSERIIQIINCIIENLGYSSNVKLFSIRGIIGVLDLLVLIIIFILFGYVKSWFNKFTYAEKIVLLYTAYSWVLNIGVLIFTDSACESRYFLPQVVMTVISMNILFNYCEKPYRLIVKYLFLCFIVGNVLLGYRIWLTVDNNSAEMREAVEYLVEEGYKYGYTKFYTGDVIPELTNGQIDIYCVSDYETMAPNKYLMKKEMLENKNSEDKTFILMTHQEYEDSKEFPYIQKGKIDYENDRYIVLEYESISEMWDMIQAF